MKIDIWTHAIGERIVKHLPNIFLISDHIVGGHYESQSVKWCLILATGGLTENDFILAAKINQLQVEDLLRKKKVAKWEDVLVYKLCQTSIRSMQYENKGELEWHVYVSSASMVLVKLFLFLQSQNPQRGSVAISVEQVRFILQQINFIQDNKLCLFIYKPQTIQPNLHNIFTFKNLHDLYKRHCYSSNR